MEEAVLQYLYQVALRGSLRHRLCVQACRRYGRHVCDLDAWCVLECEDGGGAAYWGVGGVVYGVELRDL